MHFSNEFLSVFNTYMYVLVNICLKYIKEYMLVPLKIISTDSNMKHAIRHRYPLLAPLATILQQALELMLTAKTMTRSFSPMVTD
jgi:hypothetical protein